MPSFQISITPGRRAAGRFVTAVRRSIQKMYSEESKKRVLKQTDIARAIGVHRSVINRQLHGREDMSLARVAELAWAMGRRAVIDFPEIAAPADSNIAPMQTRIINSTTTDVDATLAPVVTVKNSGSKYSRKVA